jgi:hypothetical protein
MRLDLSADAANSLFVVCLSNPAYAVSLNFPDTTLGREYFGTERRIAYQLGS